MNELLCFYETCNSKNDSDFPFQLNIVSVFARITITCSLRLQACMYSSYSLTWMKHFISHASDEVQGLFSLHASAVEEFHHVVQYFGENTKDMTSVEFFSIFGEFLIKFEVGRS